MSAKSGSGGIQEQAETADQIRDAVLRVPGVAGLSGGVAGEVATYLPGRRVNGVRRDATGTHVHVVLTAGARIPEVADAVRAAVAGVAQGAVHVHVEDLALGTTTKESGR